jgi:hypothetical protein
MSNEQPTATSGMKSETKPKDSIPDFHDPLNQPLNPSPDSRSQFAHHVLGNKVSQYGFH